jgi:hypothetical protein
MSVSSCIYDELYNYGHSQSPVYPSSHKIDRKKITELVKVYKNKKAQEYKHTPKFLEEDNRCFGQQEVKCSEEVSVKPSALSICRGKDGVSYTTNWDKEIKTDVKKAEPRSVVNSIFLGCDSGHAKTTGRDHWVNPPRLIREETTPALLKGVRAIFAPEDHVHYNEIQQYNEDAKKYHNPWVLWEIELILKGHWVTCVREPNWNCDNKYRRKDYFSLSNLCKDQVSRYKEPQTIDINGYKVPKPLTKEEGKKFDKVFVATLTSVEHFFHVFDNIYRLGLVHSTLEAAKLHREALLSFTKKD